MIMHPLSTAKILTFACVALAVSLGRPASSYGQESRALDVGTTWYNTNSALTNDVIRWPRATPTFNSQMLSFYGYIIGIEEEWSSGGAEHSHRVAQVQDGNFSDIVDVTPPVDGAFRRVYRTPYPALILDGVDRTAVQAQNDPVRESQVSDVLVYNHHSTWTGLDMERWAYSFVNDEYEDIVFLEHRFTNRSGEEKNGVYIALSAQPGTPATQPRELWADYYGATYQAYAQGDASADSMRLFYGWDGDERGSQEDDKGNPTSIWGNFTKPQYYGMSIIHADRSPSNSTNAPEQPWKAGWVPWDFDINMNEDTHGAVYEKLASGWPRNLPGDAYARTVNGQGEEVSGGPYRQLRPGIDVREFDPAAELSRIGYFVFGPYTFEPGEDVRIVTAFAGGSIDPRLAIDAGRAYESGFTQQVDLEPMPYEVRDQDGNVIVEEGELLSKDQKDRIIDMGKDMLFAEAAKARDVWRRADVRFGGDGFVSETSDSEGSGAFNIPRVPASPSLTGTSENDQVRLAWGDEAQQYPGAGAAIEKYRIYRNYKRQASATGPTDTTFVLQDSVSADVREYVDRDVIRGEDYYYYVTAVNSQGLESSPYLNRTSFAGSAEISALSPTRPPDEDWQNEVVVVPNPYHTQAAQKYGGRRLNFLNLPAYANIRIYTSTGDLVQMLEHDSNTGDIDWQRQETFSTMEIVSGVYFFVVEELDSPGGAPTGQVARGKFVVIK